MPAKKKKPAAQVAFAKKAAAVKAKADAKKAQAAVGAALIEADAEHRAAQALAPDDGRDQNDRENVHGARAPPHKHHIDKRASAIAATTTAADDELLTTPQCAAWLGVSAPWLEIGRHNGYGPPFLRLAGRLIRYRRDQVRAWLDARTHACTKEYAR